MQRLFNEGKLTHLIVNNNDKVGVNSYAYSHKGRKVKINLFTVFNIGFETSENTVGYVGFYDVNIEETEKLIKGDGTMKKCDLKDGMVVKLKGHDLRFMLNGCLIDKSGFVDDFEDEDILEVYKTRGQYFNEILSKKNLTLIWGRESEVEIKLDNILNQIKELQKSADELKEEIKGK